MNILNVVLLSIVWSIFLIAAGLLILGVERKITARLQWRVGPPWWQNFTDVIKLSAKETYSIQKRKNHNNACSKWTKKRNNRCKNENKPVRAFRYGRFLG